jgi:hypothetical protein
MSFLRDPKRIRGILKGLPGMLVTSLMILLSVMHGSRAVRVRRHFVKFGGSLMGILRHDTSFHNHEESSTEKIDVTWTFFYYTAHGTKIITPSFRAKRGIPPRFNSKIEGFLASLGMTAF